MSQDSEKELAAKAAADLVEDGMAIGLGTGSTAAHVAKILGERIKSGLKIKAVPTSEDTKRLALEVGIPLISLEDEPRLAIDIDGADEVDPSLNLIKGGGGALLREKIVAAASLRFVVIVDSKKLVDKLGKFHLPVEIVPFAFGSIKESIRELDGKPVLRKRKDGETFETDEGNWILDCDFGLISDPPALANKLSVIPGIVEHGLFIGMADSVIVGEGESVRTIARGD